MKPRLWIPASLVALFGAAYIAGPTVEIDPRLKPLDLPVDLDAYLAASEATVSKMRPGVAKMIRWADPVHRGRTPLALVYLHGFSATREEVRPLCDVVAANLGANLFYTRLTGHGRDADAMAEARVNDWLNDVAEALAVGRRLGDRVVVIGTSTGGTLATWTAAALAPDDVAAYILISPNFRPKDPTSAVLTWPWGKQMARLFVGEYRTWTAHNVQQEQFWTTRYPTDALLPMMALVDLVQDLDFGTIRTPVLVAYSPDDTVIDVEAVERRYDELGSEKKRLLTVLNPGDPSNHILAGDILSPGKTAELAAKITSFIRGL